MEEKKHTQAHAQNVQDSLTFEANERHSLLSKSQPEASGAIPGFKDSIHEHPVYKKAYATAYATSLKRLGLDDSRSSEQIPGDNTAKFVNNTPHLVPPHSGDGDDCPVPKALRGLNKEDRDQAIRYITEVAVTTAAQAARDSNRSRKAHQHQNQGTSRQPSRPAVEHSWAPGEEVEDLGLAPQPQSGGHDAPNWSKIKSSIVLLGATLLYAVIAEILVNTVDVVLESVDIDEKFLGITLFALVPNTTEFLVCLHRPNKSSPVR